MAASVIIIITTSPRDARMPSDVRPRSPARNGPGRAALVLGIVAIVFAIVPIVGDFVAIPAALLAVVLGVVGLLRVEKGIATNQGAALAGMILGFLAGFITLLVIAATTAGPG